VCAAGGLPVSPRSGRDRHPVFPAHSGGGGAGGGKRPGRPEGGAPARRCPRSIGSPPLFAMDAGDRSEGGFGARRRSVGRGVRADRGGMARCRPGCSVAGRLPAVPLLPGEHRDLRDDGEPAAGPPLGRRLPGGSSHGGLPGPPLRRAGTASLRRAVLPRSPDGHPLRVRRGDPRRHRGGCGTRDDRRHRGEDDRGGPALRGDDGRGRDDPLGGGGVPQGGDPALRGSGDRRGFRLFPLPRDLAQRRRGGGPTEKRWWGSSPRAASSGRLRTGAGKVSSNGRCTSPSR